MIQELDPNSGSNNSATNILTTNGGTNCNNAISTLKSNIQSTLEDLGNKVDNYVVFKKSKIRNWREN